MNHLRLAAEKRVQRYNKIWETARILGRKIRNICGNEEKVVILCGEWGFSSLRLAQKSYKSYFPRIHLVFFRHSVINSHLVRTDLQQ